MRPGLGEDAVDRRTQESSLLERRHDDGDQVGGAHGEGGERSTEPPVPPPCWCGERRGDEPAPDFGRDDYVRCPACGTLRFAGEIDREAHARVADDRSGFYGRAYWDEFVPHVLGHPGLDERARSDLPGRAAFHLQRILERLPPSPAAAEEARREPEEGREAEEPAAAAVLELGCGHGGLVHLLAAAGFAAEGLELDPEVVAAAERRFDVPVHRGPLEDAVERGAVRASYRAVVAIDLLEHLTEPLATLRLCRRLLGADGLLFLQTPCWRGEGADWPMFSPPEHLHLFTADSLQQILARAGFPAVRLLPSLFPHDVWAVATPARELPPRRDPRRGLPPLLSALLGAAAEARRLSAELAEARAERRGREAMIARLDEELAEVRADQSEKERLIARLSAELEDVRGDQAGQEALIAEISAELADVRQDQSAKEELIARMSKELVEVRTDQAGKEALLAEIGPELDGARRDQRAKEELIARISGELEEVRADQQAKERVIAELDRRLRGRDGEAGS